MRPLLPLVASLALVHAAHAQCEAQRLRSENLGRADRFGRALDLEHALAVVGAPHDDAAGSATGSAYVLELTDVGWRAAGRLKASDPDALDRFGWDVGVSAEGRVAASAPFDDEGGQDAGAAYVFERNGTRWTEAKLLAPDAGPGDRLGAFVDLDRDVLVAGAPGDADGGIDAGAAYVFERTGSGWTCAAKLVAGDAGPGRELGRAGAVAGERAVVGAPAGGAPAGGAPPVVGVPVVGAPAGSIGAVYVFERTSGAWTEVAQLVPFDGTAGDAFGAACALDGNRLAVGAPNAGAVYVFERGPSGWSFTQRLSVPNAASIAFGASLALDGARLLVGAPDDDRAAGPSEPRTGAAYLFEHDGTSWTGSAVLVASDAAAGEELGSSVGLSAFMALAGAPDASALEPRGSVRAFAFLGSDCTANGRPDVCDVFDGSPDLDLDGRPDECGESIGTRYCFGDGTGTPCPCGNESPLFHDEGCEHSIGVGVRLDAIGVPSLSADSVLLTATGLPDHVLTVFFQGTERQLVGGAPFGDGLLCVAGTLTRLGASRSQFATATLPRAGAAPVSSRGAVLAPGFRTYQAWLRDPADAFCTPAAYNLSGAVELYWGP